jgi:NAD(P)-dependent dehydrogenase (short-subunit alcohol dehydrogenase family)
MRKVCVITGGGGGMGMETAKIMGKTNYIVLVGRTQEKLETARKALKAEGVKAESYVCDISKPDAVGELADHAKKLGTITAVINAAGMSPHMGDPKTIMEANALGTININEAFFEVMEKGSCIIDVSSMAGYIIPKIILPTRCYKYSRLNKEIFIRKMMSRVNLFPKKIRSGLAYGISKHFIIWYAKTDAAKFGEKGVRVISVSPGSFETSMGEVEKKRAGDITKYCALKRFGHVEEIANLLAFCASDKAGYLTGVDILCDGGLVASGYNPLKRNKTRD